MGNEIPTQRVADARAILQFLPDDVEAIEDEANRKRSEAAKAGKVGKASKKISGATSSGSTKAKPDHKGADALAAASKTNRGSRSRISRRMV